MTGVNTGSNGIFENIVVHLDQVYFRAFVASTLLPINIALSRILVDQLPRLIRYKLSLTLSLKVLLIDPVDILLRVFTRHM